MQFQFAIMQFNALQIVRVIKITLSYRLLVLGHRNLIKNMKQISGNEHCEKSHFTNLTFRMLCNIHFQKYDRYKILRTIIYGYEKGSGT